MASQQIENIICDAVNILVDAKIADLKFDKTIQATILECINESNGTYRVKYQNSTFYAYAQDVDMTYRVSQQVYILVPNGDFNQKKSIIGTVDKLGTDYIKLIEEERKVEKNTENLVTKSTTASFCSYRGAQTAEVLSSLGIDTTLISLFKDISNVLILAGSFQTELPEEQQLGHGNYGIVLTAQYYSDAYKDTGIQTSADLVTRQYVLDAYNMTGQPYNYKIASRQYMVFPIDGKNLKQITSIQLFCKDFPEYDLSVAKKDIHISNLEIYLGQLIDTSDLESTFLTISTPYGSYYTASTLNSSKMLQANLTHQGKQVSLSTRPSGTEIYWFVQDNSIAVGSTGYHTYGGPGWRILNSPVKTSDGTVYYKSAEYRQNITASMCPSYETVFKCVINYGGTLITAKRVFYNLSASKVSISSSAGTNFNFDFGTTTLTALYAGSVHTEYTYSWTVSIDGAAAISVSSKTPYVNDVAIKTALNSLEYSVTVFNSAGLNIGTASIVLTNSHTMGQYQTILHNGSQLFKYDGFGTSPASPSVPEKDRMVLTALSFDVYNSNGDVITLDDNEKIKMCDITWTLPNKSNSLITYNYTGTTDANGNVILKNSAQVVYGIRNTYDSTATNNEIILDVTYKGVKMTTSTTFTFTKEGELGTNGTKYTVRIVPRDNKYEKIFVNNNAVYASYWYSGTTMRTQNIGSGALKAEIWDGGEKAVFSSYSASGLSWSNIVLLNSASQRITTFNVGVANGALTPSRAAAQSTVIKAELTSTAYSPLARNYYGYYPLQVGTVPSGWSAFVDDGYETIEYEPDGTRPSYTKKPFRLRIFYNGIEQSVTGTNITWSNTWGGTIPTGGGGNGQNLYAPKVLDKYDNTRTNHFVTCTYRNGSGLFTIYVAVHHYLNQYSMTNVNNWDGNAIQIDNNNGFILAPQVGAGQKNSDNTFTGVVMGKTMQDAKTDIGLFGYAKGQRSIFLDASTGAAYFGISGAGQIILNPSNGQAIIQSGNYSVNSQGTKINLTDGTIDMAHFKVDKYGNIQATNGNFSGKITSSEGTIGGWTINSTGLKNGNCYFDINNGLKMGSKFSVSIDGVLKAQDGEFKGSIEAKSGSIGRWTINSDGLIYGSGSSYFSPNNGLKLGSYFSVDSSGNVDISGEGSISLGTFYADRNTVSAKQATFTDCYLDNCYFNGKIYFTRNGVYLYVNSSDYGLHKVGPAGSKHIATRSWCEGKNENFDGFVKVKDLESKVKKIIDLSKYVTKSDYNNHTHNYVQPKDDYAKENEHKTSKPN